ALMSGRGIGPVDHGELAMRIAAETFTVRFLGTFGEQTPDGVVALEDVFAAAAAAAEDLGDVSVQRVGNAADHVAVGTFEVTPDGLVPGARSHAEVIAGGIGRLVETSFSPDANIIRALALASFAGLSAVMLPWLLSSGTLVLHQPFDGAAFATQCREHSDVAVVPGPLISRLTEAGLVGRSGSPRTVLAVWRAP